MTNYSNFSIYIYIMVGHCLSLYWLYDYSTHNLITCCAGQWYWFLRVFTRALWAKDR